MGEILQNSENYYQLDSENDRKESNVNCLTVLFMAC